MSDLLPADMRAFRRVEDAFRAAASRWGYGEIRTPTLESYSLFTEAGALTPEMLSRVYTFLDWDGWSGERVVLRPDSTVPAARATVEHGLAIPVRLFYVQNSFRFVEDDSRAETWQCGLEYVGAPGVLGDLEVAAIGCEVLESLGARPVVHLSHVGVARGVLDLLRQAGTEVTPDLSDEVTAQGLRALRPPGAGTVAGLLDAASEPSDNPAILANIGALAGDGSPDIARAVEEMGNITAALQQAGREVMIDLAMPADFEYYTGPVFEFRVDAQEVGRGGRYELCGTLGSHSAAGLGLDMASLAGPSGTGGDEVTFVAVVPASASDYGRAVGVARTLHRSDVPASLEQTDGPRVTVRVADQALELHAEGETHRVGSVDELVPLLLRYK